MSELPYLFDFKVPLFEKLTKKQEQLGMRMTDTWVDFAESGKTDWPSFQRRLRAVTDLGAVEAHGVRQGPQLRVLEEPPLTPSAETPERISGSRDSHLWRHLTHIT
ncbi:hypothetical protein [Streptomyces sp. NPDC002587]